VSSVPSIKIFQFPWQAMAWPLSLDENKKFPEFIQPSNGSFVASIGNNQSFDVGITQTSNARKSIARDQKVIFFEELPGPGVKGYQKKFLPVKISDKFGEYSSFEIEYVDAHIHPDSRDVDGLENILVDNDPFETFFDGILGLMQNSIDYIYKKNFKMKMFEARTIYWNDLYEYLVDYKEDDVAKQSLIVELAEKSPTCLKDICRSPKKLLKRIRQNQRLHRIQELDNQCIIDYAQRPGVTSAQKAGQRQRLLSVVRVESLDTLENRVVLDFCRLSRKAATRYDRENSHIKRSPRLECVRRFSRLCRKVLTDGKFQDVRKLTAPCKVPNNTLLQNDLYSEVWQDYQKLLKDIDVRDEVWRWQRRAWVDVVKIFLSFSMLKLEKSGLFPIVERPHKKPVKIAKEQTMGRWLLKDPFPGPFIFGESEKNTISLYIVDGDQIDDFISASLTISICNADFYFVWISNLTGVVSVVPVWGMLGDARWNDLNNKKELVGGFKKDLIDNLRVFDGHLKKNEGGRDVAQRLRLRGGIIVRGNWMAKKENDFLFDFQKGEKSEVPIWYIEIGADKGQWNKMLMNLVEPLGELLCEDF